MRQALRVCGILTSAYDKGVPVDILSRGKGREMSW